MEKITLSKLINDVDAKKSNAYSDEQKTEWVNKVEGMIQLEIHNAAIDDVVRYNWEEDRQTELLVPFPYYDVYTFYLYAMIDYENREIQSYNNHMVMFNNAYSSYDAWYKKQHPKSTSFKNYW